MFDFTDLDFSLLSFHRFARSGSLGITYFTMQDLCKTGQFEWIDRDFRKLNRPERVLRKSVLAKIKRIWAKNVVYVPGDTFQGGIGMFGSARSFYTVLNDPERVFKTTIQAYMQASDIR